MNAVVALCHFCEVHGPSVLACTQGFASKPKLTRNDTFEPPESRDCDACSALTIRSTKCNSEEFGHFGGRARQAEGFFSMDEETGIWFLTSKRCLSDLTATAVRCACVRSLSCEIHPPSGDDGSGGYCKEGIYFGDTERGHSLSFFFTLKDSSARGFKRSFSIVVFSFDRAYLLTAWKVIAVRVEKFVQFAGARAKEVSEEGQNEENERAARLKRRCLGNESHVRSIIDITGVKDIFVKFHENFVWTLKATHLRFEEHPVKPPSEPKVALPVWSSMAATVEVLRQLASCSCEEDVNRYPAFLDALVTGRGPVVMFTAAGGMEECGCRLLALADLAPDGAIRAKAMTEQEFASVDGMAELARLDLVGVACSRRHSGHQLPSSIGSRRNVDWVDIPAHTLTDSSTQHVSVTFAKPPKCSSDRYPEYVTKIATAVRDSSLSSTVVASLMVALKQKMLNRARTFAAVKKSQPGWSDQKILSTLALTAIDLPLYQHWASSF